ncbi:hypothetical protein MIR68_003969 [Amoeboaphelidium protococcarum]|nr:hypothetical protein MIR68_003969 [Amoeboaphelidium protococcarum]
MIMSQSSSPNLQQQLHQGNTLQQDATNRALESLRTIYSLASKHGYDIVEQDDFWTLFWLPTLKVLASNCLNSVKEIRQQSFSYLQRALLLPNIEKSNGQWNAQLIFHDVLIPFVDQVLRLVEPPSADEDSANAVQPVTVTQMDEVPIRLCTLLCKVYLHYSQTIYENLSEESQIALWTSILDSLQRFYHAVGDQDQSNAQGTQSSRFQQLRPEASTLLEAIPESIKNMLLVLSTSPVFGSVIEAVDHGPQVENAMWKATWSHLDQWLPQLKYELFPNHFDKPNGTSIDSPAAIVDVQSQLR